MANRRTCLWCRYGIGAPYTNAHALFGSYRMLCPEHKRQRRRLQMLAAARARANDAHLHVERMPSIVRIAMDVAPHVRTGELTDQQGRQLVQQRYEQALQERRRG